MSSTGSPANPNGPEQAPVEATDADAVSEDDGRFPWALLAGLGVVLVIVLVFGFRLMGALLVVLFPPNPPLPANVIEQAHQHLTHGVDQWVYTVMADGETVLNFYREQGGECITVRLPQSDIVGAPERLGWRCRVQEPYAAFAWRWQADVLPQRDLTTLRLTRTIYWDGELPDDTLNTAETTAPASSDVPLVESTEVSNN